jgi:hypothetical protein
MNPLNLDAFVAIPISTEIYSQLLQRYPGRMTSLVEDVVLDFLDRTKSESTTGRTSEGLQWDAVFLPAGTEIRTKYRGEYKIGIVREEGSIVRNGTAYSSPSKFASAMRGGTSNNAWMILSVKRPTDTAWMLANTLRR